jgi:Tfp pilus assembly major pilin PilA
MTKPEVQEALHELLAAGYVDILSTGGGPKYCKVTSKAYVLAALAAADAEA